MMDSGGNSAHEATEQTRAGGLTDGVLEALALELRSRRRTPDHALSPRMTIEAKIPEGGVVTSQRVPARGH
eukprot:516123-Hanusia_phi.AAC.6